MEQVRKNAAIYTVGINAPMPMRPQRKTLEAPLFTVIHPYTDIITLIWTYITLMDSKYDAQRPLGKQRIRKRPHFTR